MTQHTFLNKITIEKNTTCANTLQMQMLCLFFIEYNADKVGAADVLREDRPFEPISEIAHLNLT